MTSMSCYRSLNHVVSGQFFTRCSSISCSLTVWLSLYNVRSDSCVIAYCYVLCFVCQRITTPCASVTTWLFTVAMISCTLNLNFREKIYKIVARSWHSLCKPWTMNESVYKHTLVKSALWLFMFCVCVHVNFLSVLHMCRLNVRSVTFFNCMIVIFMSCNVFYAVTCFGHLRDVAWLFSAP